MGSSRLLEMARAVRLAALAPGLLILGLVFRVLLGFLPLDLLHREGLEFRGVALGQTDGDSLLQNVQVGHGANALRVSASLPSLGIFLRVAS